MSFNVGTLDPAVSSGEPPLRRLFARFVALHEYGPRGLWYLGIMGLVISPLFYLLRFTKAEPVYDDWWVRVLQMATGAAICLRAKWPEAWKPYFYHFAYFALIFTCPFAFVFKGLQDGGGAVSVGNTLLATVFVLMLSDWRNMIIIMATGIAGATLMYIATAPDPSMPADYVQRLPILFATMLGGALFKRAFEAATVERTKALERQVSESRVATLQQSIGFLAHELNTPLATVRLSVSSVASQFGGPNREDKHCPSTESPSDSESRELLALLETAEAQALYCQALVDQVMKSAFHFRPNAASKFNAAELVRSLVESYPFSAAERRWINVKVVRDFTMTGSRELFFLVLSTLTKNALLSLRGRPNQLLQFEIDGDLNVEGIGTIRLSDTGIGIPKAKLETLTKSAVRSTWPGVEGEGMGLMFCARVMEACNGSLTIESEFDVGSTVTLQFSPSWIQV